MCLVFGNCTVRACGGDHPVWFCGGNDSVGCGPACRTVGMQWTMHLLLRPPGSMKHLSALTSHTVSTSRRHEAAPSSTHINCQVFQACCPTRRHIQERQMMRLQLSPLPCAHRTSCMLADLLSAQGFPAILKARQLSQWVVPESI